jgi:hypothetical protein
VRGRPKKKRKCFSFYFSNKTAAIFPFLSNQKSFLGIGPKIKVV